MKEQVKSLFEEYIKSKRLELKTAQETFRLNCYNHQTSLREIVENDSKVIARYSEIKKRIKDIFKDWSVSGPRYDCYYSGHFPTPNYYNEQYTKNTVRIDLIFNINFAKDCYGRGQSIEERMCFSFPFTGELKKLTLDWQKDVKEYWQLEIKHRKLTEFEKNLDNQVNIFLLKNQNPELYHAAENFVCDIINGIDKDIEK